MIPVSIQKRFVDEYRRRLEVLQPRLDRIRETLSNMSRRTDLFYIGGNVAAWLVGRTDELCGRGGIDIVAFETIPNLVYRSVRFFGMPHPRNPNNRFWFNDSPIEGEGRIGYLNYPIRYMLRPKFEPIYDISAIEVLVKLFEPDVVYSAECPCDYESRCVVTNDGHYERGVVVYPMLCDLPFDATATINSLPLDCHDKIRVVPNGEGKSFRTDDDDGYNSKLFIMYAVRLFLDARPYDDVMLSFCDYSQTCDKCKQRDVLALKYFKKWTQKTYAPGGRGCLNAAKRFETLSSYLNSNK